jgi:hypothetical protein
VTDFNMEIHTSSNGFISHHKNNHQPNDTTSSSFDIRQTFAQFLQSLGRNMPNTNKETEIMRNDDQAEVRFGSKIVSCMRREIEFMSKLSQMYLFIDVTQV